MRRRRRCGPTTRSPADTPPQGGRTFGAARPSSYPGTMIREPLEYDAFFAHRTVTRLRDGDGTAIEKVTEGPGLAAEYLYDNALREFAAYTSGLLGDLGPVRAPRVIEAREEADGR